MYKITINRKLGDYVKGLEGTIYQITSISVNIVINEMTGEEEVRTFYEGFDLQDPLGQYYIINEGVVTDVTEEEVKSYTRVPPEEFAEKDEDGWSEIMDLFVDIDESLNEEEVETSNEISTEITNEMEMSNVEKRTLNDILNDFLAYKDLTVIFGDEEYEEEINSLLKEFDEYSAKGEKSRVADEILDDYLIYKKLVEVLKCDENKYKDKMDTLMKEFNDVSGAVLK